MPKVAGVPALSIHDYLFGFLESCIQHRLHHISQNKVPTARGTFDKKKVVFVYTKNQAASDKVYQLLAHGRWFSPGTPASSITKTCPYDVAEILLKVALSTIKL